MSAPLTSVPSRNHSMECFKMIAAIVVVLLHQPFPGQLGTVVSVVGSIAVPMFLPSPATLIMVQTGKR